VSAAFDLGDKALAAQAAGETGNAMTPGQAVDWGLYVNECAIFASRIADGRWLDFQGRAAESRLTMLWMGPAGGEWHVMCGTKADAVDACDLFLEVGFHKSHIKVARLSACQAKAAERGRPATAALAVAR